MRGKGTLRVLLILVFIIISTLIYANDEEEPRVTLIFQEDDLLFVLSEITLQTGVNIIADDSVGGAVTVDLTDVPLEYALDVILTPRDIYYRKENGYYFVCLADPRARGFVKIAEMELIKLKYISAAEFQNLIPDYYLLFLKINEANNTLTINAPRKIIDQFMELLNMIDIERKQLKVSVMAVEISKELIKEKSPMTFSIELPSDFADLGWNGMNLSWGEDPFTIGADLFNWLSVNMRILEEKNLAEIHSDPNIMVMDGEVADVFVGETRSINTGQGIQSVDIGVALSLRPTTYPEYIEMELAPSVSHFAYGDGSGFVVFRNDVASTIRVKPGQTAVLAGINTRRNYESVSKVPILGDIPLIRWLFSGENEGESEREFLIFVTPYLQNEVTDDATKN